MQLRKTKWFSAIFLLGIVVLASCKKIENQDLGLQVQPQGDRVNIASLDTLTVLSHTVLEDSLRSDEFSNSLLGSYVDPVFGKTTSSVYTHIRLGGNTTNFAPVGGTISDVVVDSMVLYIDLGIFYGNLSAQEFEIYRVTEDFERDSTYFTNTTLTHDLTNLVEPGKGLITPDPFGKDSLDGEEVDAFLRVPMSLQLANDILAENGNAPLADNDSDGGFVDWFKGLFITVNNPTQGVGEGAILSLDLIKPNTKMVMYYRHTLSGAEDTLKYDFLINSSCARFNSITHDYNGTNIQSQLADTTLGQFSTYVQAMAGVKTKIEIPYLLSLKDSGVVNKAELVIPFEYFDGDPYAPQDRLFLLGIDEEGKTFFLDDQSEGEAHYGGKVDSDANEYRINLTKHVNNVLIGSRSNTPFYLTSSSAAVTANRVVINGQNSTNKNKMKLEVTYSQF